MPVTVRVEVPTSDPTPEAAFSVIVLLPFPGAAMVVGKQVAVTPLGSPLTAKAIAALNPFSAAVITLIDVVPPRFMLALLTPGATENAGVRTVRRTG